MPLSFDCDLKGADEFLSSSASTLYWKPVPVLLRHVDREDQTDELTIRILSGVAKQNSSLRILRIHISNEQDLCFLHTLEVTEEDFQRLKAEQGILVDFANFPAKVVGLLERCISSTPNDAPRFQAVLSIRGADSAFSIVETNDFKQLPHISLSFCPGNDNTIKQFLAFRLSEVRADYDRVSLQLSTIKEEKQLADVNLSQCNEKYIVLKERHDQHVLEAQAQIKAQLVQAQEDKANEMAHLTEKMQRDREEAEAKLREQLEQVNNRVNELDAENRKLRDQKYQLDCKVSELSHKVGSAEGMCSSLDEEKAQLKLANNQLHSEMHQKDIQLNDVQAKLAAAEEKLRASADLSGHHKLRLTDLESSCKQWEDRWKEVRETASGHEQRAREASAEVVKGNQIIEKLTTELRVSREKARRKAAIMSRQEEELHQRQNELASEQCKTANLQSAVDKLQVEVSQLHSEKERLNNTIKDNQQQLEQNEQMIRWLNQQVTDAQLQLAGGGTTSRFSMKPLTGLSSTMGALPSASSGPLSYLTGTTNAGVGANMPTSMSPAKIPATMSIASSRRYGVGALVGGIGTPGVSSVKGPDPLAGFTAKLPLSSMPVNTSMA